MRQCHPACSVTWRAALSVHVPERENKKLQPTYNHTESASHHNGALHNPAQSRVHGTNPSAERVQPHICQEHDANEAEVRYSITPATRKPERRRIPPTKQKGATWDRDGDAQARAEAEPPYRNNKRDYRCHYVARDAVVRGGPTLQPSNDPPHASTQHIPGVDDSPHTLQGTGAGRAYRVRLEGVEGVREMGRAQTEVRIFVIAERQAGCAATIYPSEPPPQTSHTARGICPTERSSAFVQAQGRAWAYGGAAEDVESSKRGVIPRMDGWAQDGRRVITETGSCNQAHGAGMVGARRGDSAEGRRMVGRAGSLRESPLSYNGVYLALLVAEEDRQGENEHDGVGGGREQEMGARRRKGYHRKCTTEPVSLGSTRGTRAP
ncbi:hypothetical protein DFP72DRAFT_851469 [Ephemerocybe angulata]|uniref:Uncharacterized protein n=1 Tax=Ephemerocybe angulata TaxID=980116 RepID=A0A8H6HPA7_9AGAR|nr:hypothetical protein DFP72DRAFT_851469 [Tulosesus angulatus]